jgi:hypothetical protein
MDENMGLLTDAILVNKDLEDSENVVLVETVEGIEAIWQEVRKFFIKGAWLSLGQISLSLQRI